MDKISNIDELIERVIYLLVLYGIDHLQEFFEYFLVIGILKSDFNFFENKYYSLTYLLDYRQYI